MKFGDQLEHESVPQWSLHNLDYNSLKHQIKVHTTRHQASAIAIPGQQDVALQKFEDGLYLELCRQHERVDLFVTSKVNEITRRLDHLGSQIQRWITKSPQEPTTSQTLKRHRRFVKYERELSRCGDDVQALSRFARAQIIAFRKIVKKYKKWTGSTTLGARFSDNVLKDPKSFTHRDFLSLQDRYDEIMAKLQAASPQFSEPTSPSSLDQSSPELQSPSSRAPPPVDFRPLPPAMHASQGKYWNEYDDGSDAGGPEDDYAIYINPDEDSGFPGWGYVQAVLTLPFEKARQWFQTTSSSEHQPLLSGNRNPSAGSGIPNGYASTSADSEEEGYSSSEDFPSHGYAALYAFPSIGEQKVRRYRERVLFWGTVGCYAVSFVLVGIAGVLLSTGRHKLRVEVDAGVTVGVMVSLFFAFTALGMTLYRQDSPSLTYWIMTWSAFVASCLLNGMLLVLVVGNSP